MGLNCDFLANLSLLNVVYAIHSQIKQSHNLICYFLHHKYGLKQNKEINNMYCVLIAWGKKGKVAIEARFKYHCVVVSIRN